MVSRRRGRTLGLVAAAGGGLILASCCSQESGDGWSVEDTLGQARAIAVLSGACRCGRWRLRSFIAKAMRRKSG